MPATGFRVCPHWRPTRSDVKHRVWVFVLSVLVLAGTVTAAAAGRSAEVQTTFQISGMHCDGCSATIVGTLERTDGVTFATADHEKGIAHAVYNTKKVSAEDLKAAIEKLGYTVTEMSTEPVEG